MGDNGAFWSALLCCIVFDGSVGIDAQVQKTVSERFDLQSADAQFFHNVLLKYYHEVSKQH